MVTRASIGVIIAIAATGLVLSALTAGTLTANQSGKSSIITSDVDIGVYTDSTCTTNCTSVNWGNVTPTSSTEKTVWIKNTGTIPLTLSMEVTNWVPSDAGTSLALSWNREGYVLAGGNSTLSVFTLTVSENTDSLMDFSANIVITGTE